MGSRKKGRDYGHTSSEFLFSMVVTINTRDIASTYRLTIYELVTIGRLAPILLVILFTLADNCPMMQNNTEHLIRRNQ